MSKKTIAALCREFLRKNTSFSLKALEEEAKIGKEGKRTGGVLSAFKKSGGLSNHNLVCLVACLLDKGLKITPNQAYANVDTDTSTLYIGFYQAIRDVETVREANTTMYVQTIERNIFNKFDFEASPKTPKKWAHWWLTEEWEQTPMPETTSLMAEILSCTAEGQGYRLNILVQCVEGSIIAQINSPTAHKIGEMVAIKRIITQNRFETKYELASEAEA